MDDNLIPLSMLNDYIFCPYSIYLHNIYMGTDEGLYHATPQTQGKIAHESIDSKKASTRKDDFLSLPVCSNQLGIMGRIDLYRGAEQHLIERKYRLKQIFRGQLYQLWGEYFCMVEMGYPIQKLSFYEISSNTVIPQPIPGEKERAELQEFIVLFKSFDPAIPIVTNSNKCQHCIYCPLCEKAELENVYQ